MKKILIAFGSVVLAALLFIGGGDSRDDGKLTGWDAWKYLWENDKVGDATKAATAVVKVQVEQDMLRFSNFVADVAAEK